MGPETRKGKETSGEKKGREEPCGSNIETRAWEGKEIICHVPNFIRKNEKWASPTALRPEVLF